MRILLLGKHGQLGRELSVALATMAELVAFGRSEIDLNDLENLPKLVDHIRPDVIVNAAAYTDVDKAETEQEHAWRINAVAPAVLAKQARRLRALFVHYSTDYVFDGKKETPYHEQDATNPLNFYGASKLEGERRIQDMGGTFLILRTSWVYSVGKQGGFVNKILQLSRKQHKLSMVTDQVGSPTWAYMLAKVTAQILAHGKDALSEYSGLYHLAASGYTSRFEWARCILELDPNKAQQTVQDLLPAVTSSFPSPAVRPLFSALSCDKFARTFGASLPDWRESLAQALDRE